MPCDYSKYPKNWKAEIRPRIQQRAGNKCEKCGVENHAIGARDRFEEKLDKEAQRILEKYW